MEKKQCLVESGLIKLIVNSSILVNNGMTETVQDVEKHINNKTLVNYLYEKYNSKVDMQVIVDCYSPNDIHNLLDDMSYSIGKTGIDHKGNGLLLLINICAFTLQNLIV